ncbi:MAG TPA: hypothetical protein VGR37_24065 [Longimicrobiaceae bacterium]|nr:hypothetical protein [Longimicrobiaceae bacterium]
MRRQHSLLALAAAALLAAGCERSATSPGDASLGSADAALLAQELDALSGAVLGGQVGSWVGLSVGSSAEPVPVERTFTATRPCPAGGSVAVSGSMKGEIDRAARSLTLETTATKTQSACAFPARRSGGAVLTVTGNPSITVRSAHRVVNGLPSGPQTVSQTGGFTWSASDGRSGACTLDVTSTLEPASRTLTVKGTMCGHTVDVTRQVGR